MSKRLLYPCAAITALLLVLAGCSKSTPTTPVAAACTNAKLKTTAALRAPGTNPGSVTAAGVIHTITAQASKPEVKIGFFGDLTGANSSLVVPERNAAELAFDQANAAGTHAVTFTFVPKDNKDASADTAPAIEQGFIADSKVVAVIGGAFSGETLAVGKLFSKAGLVHLSASATNPAITTNGWPFYRLLSTDAVQGAKAADVLAGIGCKNVAVIDDKEDYGKGLADYTAKELAAKGVTVVDREGVAQKTGDYGPLVDTLISKSPDAVFYGGYYNDGSQILKQMRQKGLKALFMCGDGCDDNALIAQAGAANANGAILTCPCVIPIFSKDPAAVKLAADYKAKFNKDAALYTAEAYDAANMLISCADGAAADGSVTRPEMLTCMKNIKDFKGVSKTFNFDSTGEIAGGVINVYTVNNGAIALVGLADSVI